MMQDSSVIKFFIESENTNQHLFKVHCQFFSLSKSTQFQMPNWTPGSYMIREYSRFVYGFKCNHSWEQSNLNEWTILGKGAIEIEYFVYAFDDLSVRTNYLDEDLGLVIPAGLFIHPILNTNFNIEIHWLNIKEKFQVFCPLSKITENAYQADSFDLLYDSPFILTEANPISLSVEFGNHDIIIHGDIPNDLQLKLCNDLNKIIQIQNKIMGYSPNSYYLFILILSDGAYGGLEHRASSVNIFDGSKLQDRNEYIKLLELLSHEYFHLWNVKRIRPIALDPFDYSKPNLTRELWIAEGITSFYDAYFLLLADLITNDEYLAKLILDINLLEDNQGESIMSLEESSYTAWNKFYKRTNNSHNTGISYYTKGGLLVLCMQIRILVETNGSKNFSLVMQKLYESYYLKQNRGFTKAEFFDTIQEVTGLDLFTEFNIYLVRMERIPISEYLKLIGIIKIIEKPTNELGFNCKETSQGLFVEKIFQSRMDPNAEIYIADELISINNKRVTTNNHIQNTISNLPLSSKISLLINRKSKIKEIILQLNKAFAERKLIIDSDEDLNHSLFNKLFKKF
jgi:predicted metalloprotease with PDZ domain